MKFIERFHQYFGFTKNESRIVLFLVSTFLVGMVLKLSNVSFRSQPEFDYTESDSIFAARSQHHLESSMDDDVARHDSAVSASSSLININSASKEELMQLPGIGLTMAERIIQYRKEHGPFQNVEDLQNVKGIGKKKFERIAPFVKVK